MFHELLLGPVNIRESSWMEKQSWELLKGVFKATKAKTNLLITFYYLTSLIGFDLIC